jgi:hypothetical protein
MVEFIKEVELLAIKESAYTIYVFKELKTDNYIMCTKLPNWQTSTLYVGDKGFLQYQIVKAGDKYYDINENIEITYKYSNVYFINFVNSCEINNKKEIIL